MTQTLSAAVVACLLAGGCTLVDQRTFMRAGAAPAASELARVTLPPLPLAVVRFDQPDFDYMPALAQAVEDAQARKPDAAFDVVAPVPTAVSAEAQDQASKQGQADTETVANALMTAGVSPDHVFMGLRGDPGTPAREVRIYVR